MTKLPDDIVELVSSEKQLGSSPNWDDESDPRYSTFTHALVVGDVGGFQLRAYFSKRWVHRDAMLQLEYAPAGRRSEVPLWRLDWRRFHNHVNKAWPPDLAYQSFGGSHQHPFSDNYMASELRMRGQNLPAGRLFPSDPNNLSEFIALAGQLFRIKDMRLVSMPVIGPDIFWRE